jgi:hypothetical protein
LDREAHDLDSAEQRRASIGLPDNVYWTASRPIAQLAWSQEEALAVGGRRFSDACIGDT